MQNEEKSAISEGAFRRVRGVRRGGGGRRTFEEVALLDAELAYAGAEPEEGEAEDGAEQCHGCRSIGRVARSMLRNKKRWCPSRICLGAQVGAQVGVNAGVWL
jgi:hypothetical protein